MRDIDLDLHHGHQNCLRLNVIIILQLLYRDRSRYKAHINQIYIYSEDERTLFVTQEVNNTVCSPLNFAAEIDLWCKLRIYMNTGRPMNELCIPLPWHISNQ